MKNEAKITNPLSEKIDFQTNNPRKLFRAISDLSEEQMIKRNYKIVDEGEPTLEKTGVHGVAEFDGNIDMIKTKRTRSKLRISVGILISIIGVLGFIFAPSLIDIPNEHYFGLIIVPIIGIIIIISRTKTEMIINIDLEGESYQYKGNKQTDISEEKQRLDVVSDIRITISGFFSKKSYYKEEYAIQLKQDVQLIKEKLNNIVPEYRIPE